MKKLLIILSLVSLGLYGCSGSSNEEIESSELSESKVIETEVETESETEVETETEIQTEVSASENERPEEETREEVDSEQVEVEPVQADEEADLRQDGLAIVSEDLAVAPAELVVLLAEPNGDNELDLYVYSGGTIYYYEIENNIIEEKEAKLQVEQDLIDELYLANDALEIAYESLGISQDDINDYDIDLDEDDGRLYYDISIVTGSGEHELEIDARTGDIISQDLDG